MSNKVLIVEDEMLIALTYEMELKDRGFEVVGISPDAKSALDCIQQTSPDFALVDIHLKGSRDGIDFVGDCRNLKLPTEFIFVTGNFDESTRSRAEAFKPLGFFVKPVHIADILPLLIQEP